MKNAHMEDKAQAETLQELMDAMGQMDAGRVKPKMPAGAIPQGVLPAAGPAAGADLGGLDPRLAEIIRKKQGR